MEAMVVMVLGTAGATTASVRLRLSPTMATEDTVEDTEATGATVATVVATTASVRPMPNLRLLLSLITDTEATVEDMEAMVVMVLDTAGATTASVRLRLSPTMGMEDTVEDTVDTVEVTEA